MKKNSKRADAKPISPKDWKADGVVVVPCPFCGTLPRFKFMPHDLDNPQFNNGIWSLGCINQTCGGKPMHFGSPKEDVAFQWNQRSSGGWISPERDMPDGDICVLMRTSSEEWPLALGWTDGVRWFELSAAPIDSTVTGWMHMEDAAGILDTIAFAKKGGAK